MDAGLARGFTIATIIPAIASTLKQAQREGADALHVLAGYRIRVDRDHQGKPDVLSHAERLAARRIGVILVEQGVNGTAFFMAVKLSVVLGGPLSGQLAQLAITGNTIATPHQTQAFNPAQRVFERLGRSPDWVGLLSERQLAAFAFYVGGFVRTCGYGLERANPSQHRFKLRFCRAAGAN